MKFSVYAHLIGTKLYICICITKTTSTQRLNSPHESAERINCLKGSTERSDDNRGRSPRKKSLQVFCLEGSTPVISSMSYGVVPSRHIFFAMPNRGLRPRLPKSYAFVVSSRHLGIKFDPTNDNHHLIP